MSVRILVVVTGWNWEKYIDRALQSVLNQTYKNYCVAVVDDGSTDKSFQRIIEFRNKVLEIDKNDDWSWQLTESNEGTIFARSGAISLRKDYDVIAFLDGDDCLLPNALEEVAKQYDAGKLMTYGNWINQDGVVCGMNLKYSDEVHRSGHYRYDTFRCTHLRTFYKHLYDAIPVWEPTKSELESYPDAELLFSMMEMCGKDRIGVIYEPIYIYNETNENRTLKRFGKDDEGYIEITQRPKRKLI